MSLHYKKCLVLNKNWLPIDIITLADAIRTVFTEYDDGNYKAKILDITNHCLFTWDEWGELTPSANEDYISGVNMRYRVPEIIVLSNYEKLPIHRNSFSRKNIIKRDKNQCQYCGEILNLLELTIDHIKPKSHGGKSSWENCVAACKKCNRFKADRTPIQANMSLIKEPKKPENTIFRLEGNHYNSWNLFVKTK